VKKIKAKTVIAMRKCSEVLCNLLPVYIISYTAYNCPNTEKYWVNKIHIGRDEIEPDMNFIDTIFSVLGQLYTV
jgi:hypothetical protein